MFSKSLIPSLMFIPSLLLGEIFETDCFGDIINYVVPNTIVFCDLDNTLIETNQLLGSVQWGDEYQTQLIALGRSPEESYQIAYKLWLDIRPITKMRLVDPNIPGIIHNMQQRGYLVLGLTARMRDEPQFTHPHLDQADIAFDRRYPDQEVVLSTGSVLYTKGILFCDQYMKGEVVLAFLKQFGLFPDRIVFIDDKLSHVKEVEETLTNAGIQYVGFHYRKSEQRIYDSQIIDIQIKHFPRLISDEDARAIIMSRS